MCVSSTVRSSETLLRSSQPPQQKAIPVQAQICPEVSRSFTLPVFQTISTMLSALPNGSLYPQEIFLVQILEKSPQVQESAVEWVTFLLSSQKVAASNLGLSASRQKRYYVHDLTFPFHILSRSSGLLRLYRPCIRLHKTFQHHR